MNKQDNKITELKKEIFKVREEVRVGVIGPLAASFGFVIALIWRDAIQAAIKEFLVRRGLTEQAYFYNFIFAVIATIIVILIIYIIRKFSKKRYRNSLQ
jgi:ABC-type uncharacterized transport system fused permease/ATPase subunit